MNKISVNERSIWILKSGLEFVDMMLKFNKYGVRDLEIAADVCKHYRLAKYYS